MNTLKIYLDSAESRVLQDRMSYYVDGQGWDNSGTVAGRYFVDAISYTAILQAYAFTPEWRQQGTGDYARLRKADYDISGNNQWVEYPLPTTDIYYLQGLGTNGTVTTNNTYPKNTGFVWEYFNYDYGSDERTAFQFGFGLDSDALLEFNVSSKGNVEVYKNGVFRVNGSLTKPIEYPIGFGVSESAKRGNQGKQLANQWVTIYAIPCRRRELLMLSSHGGGFVFQFEDIDTVDPDPTVSGSGRMWWCVPTGQPSVQAAPLKYPSAGTIISSVFTWANPPYEDADITTQVFYDIPRAGAGSASATLCEADGITPFVADGNLIDATLRVSMEASSDGYGTPFVYGASASIDPLLDFTSDDETDITEYVVSASLDVSEQNGDATFKVTVQDTTQLALDTGVNRVRTMTNRPFKATIGTTPIFFGRTKSPAFLDHWNDKAQKLELEANDYSEVLRNYIFTDPLVLDGLRLDQAIEEILFAAGYGASYLDIDFIDFELPTVGGESKSEWGYLCEVGDRAADKIDDLFNTYANTYYKGWYPSTLPTYLFASTASLGVTSAGTLYETVANALTAGYGGTVAHLHVYNTFKRTVLEPEANLIYVVGRDPRTLLPIVSYYRDVDSANPALAPASRPANWLGEPREFAYVAPFINTQEAANYAVGILRDRLSVTREVAEWTTHFMLKANGSPVWRGDVVTLEGWGNYRVRGFSAKFQREYFGTVTQGTASLVQSMIWRPTTYIGEYVGG